MGLAHLLEAIDQDEDIPVRGVAAITRLIADAAVSGIDNEAEPF